MIQIKKIQQIEEGAKCNLCYSNDNVKTLKFSPDKGSGSTSLFLCRDCRSELTHYLLAESEIEESEFRGRVNGWTPTK